MPVLVSRHCQFLCIAMDDFFAVPSLRGMGATPSRLQQKKGPVRARSDANPSRSLLEMRDKTSWTTADESTSFYLA